jgi:hypothetical protein
MAEETAKSLYNVCCVDQFSGILTQDSSPSFLSCKIPCLYEHIYENVHVPVHLHKHEHGHGRLHWNFE